MGAAPGEEEFKKFMEAVAFAEKRRDEAKKHALDAIAKEDAEKKLYEIFKGPKDEW